MTVEDAIERFRLRYLDALGVDPADVEERAAVLLEDRTDVEARVLRVGIVRLFVRRSGGAWLSRYAWTLRDVDALLGRALA